MPCFSQSPDPGTPEYEQWIPDVQSKLESFIHAADYYFAKAGEPLPHPETTDREIVRAWGNLEHYIDPVEPANWSKNALIVRQILLHLDCDGVNEFQLNDISNLFYDKLRQDLLTPKDVGYLWVLSQCFAAMRNNEV